MYKPEWTKRLAGYHGRGAFRPIFELAVTLLPYGMIMGLMALVIAFEYSLWWLLPLWLVGAGFFVRLFIVFHDCAHLSFVRNRTLCRVIGFVIGVLTFTPYEAWRHSHMIHHGSVGNIDRRGTGDVWTMTAEEYQNARPMKRLLYRGFRNPFVLFVFAPAVLFLILNRIPMKSQTPRAVRSVILTDAALLGIIVLIATTAGIKYYLLIQLPVFLIASAFGLWLFYVQHQFENVYWARRDHWDIYHAAMEGSSFYKLPRPINWMTGSIGYHHIHHLDPGIPFYNLKRCQREVEPLWHIEPLKLWASFKTIRLKVYDEKRRKLIRFKDIGNAG